MRLEEDGKESGQNRGGEEHDDRGKLAGDHQCGGYGYDEQPWREIVFALQGQGESRGVDGRMTGYEESGDGIYDQRDDDGRHSGNGHVAYMCEQWCAHHTGCQYSSVGEWRHLITEIGAGEYGSGSPAIAESKCLANAHESNANGCHGGPGAARHHRDKAADDTTAQQEDIGIDDLHAPVDQRGDHTADSPCAGEQADQ